MALVIASFALWYFNFSLQIPFWWLPLLACTALNIILVLFPTGKKQLPTLLIPFILLITLSSLHLMIGMLPHTLTPLNIIAPLLFTLLISSALILRDHSVAAWIVFGLNVLYSFKWHLGVFISHFSIAAEFWIPIAILCSVHIFKIQIQQSFHKARQSRILLQHAEFGREHEEGVSNVAALRVQEVRALSEEMLHRIAYNEDPITAEEIDEFRFSEAQLRDTIRGRYIVNDEILRAAMDARRRGTKVDILDERGEPLPQAVITSLTQCAVDLLDNAYGGTITIRAFPADDPTAVMLVHDGNSDTEEPSAIEIAQTTGEIERF
ncbi:hypothetical protein [uncultured Rothia sp.]|uniref:hypothetical protein n=1 Tax=uncultured Rothia sp. TaxID=316088 RepID=UPI0032165B5B